MKALDPGYTVEIDDIDKDLWSQLIQGFDDANIYQTWSYGAVRFGNKSLSHLVLRKGSAIVAAAQTIIKRIPVLNAGIAYLYWGPLWHAKDIPEESEVFSQILQALRNEYVSRRGLVLRVVPVLFEDDREPFSAVFSQEGFNTLPHVRRQRTLLMDLTSPLNTLRKGLDQKWRNCLNRAEKNNLDLVEGYDDGLFRVFIDIYREMHDRKNFIETSNINDFRLIQQDLPQECKMKLMVCLRNGEPVAGAVCSALGTRGIYLFGATSNRGMNSNGSYLIQWKTIEWLKSLNCSSYDLHGIDSAANPGTYRFKAGLCGTNGCHVQFLGQFEAHDSLLSHLFVRYGEAIRSRKKQMNEFLNMIDRRRRSKL